MTRDDVIRISKEVIKQLSIEITSDNLSGFNTRFVLLKLDGEVISRTILDVGPPTFNN